MKIKKWFFRLILLIGILIGLLFVTGNDHLFKGISNTYLKGKSGPDIDERDIFPFRTIKSSQPKPFELSDDYNNYQFSEKASTYLDSLQTVAFLVIKNDSIQFEQYWNGYSAEKTSNSFSMGKSIIASLVGVAIKQGLIKSVEDPVHLYLPEYKEGRNAELTIKHLLTMSSGLNFDESYSNPFGFAAKAYYGDDLKGLIREYEVTETPGEEFKYLSGNTQILAFILEKVTGTSVSEFMQETLWKVIGATNEAYWVLDHENGSEKAFTGVYATARDYAKVGKLYMRGGMITDTALISAHYIFESIKPAKLLDQSGQAITEYGYSWWIFNNEKAKGFYMRGILGQYVICLPQENAIIVRLGRMRDKKSDGKHPDDLFFYIDEARKIIKN